jgi:hypothetical protein
VLVSYPSHSLVSSFVAEVQNNLVGSQADLVVPEFGLTCEYIRERKKRGKASRKDLAQQASASAKGKQSSEDPAIATPQSQNPPSEGEKHESSKPSKSQRILPEQPTSRRSTSLATARDMKPAPDYQGRTPSLGAINVISDNEAQHLNHPMRPIHPTRNPIEEYSAIDSYHPDIAYPSPHVMMHGASHPIVPSNSSMMDYTRNPYNMINPQNANASIPTGSFRLPGDAPSVDFAGHSPISGSPGWMLPSPATTLYSGVPRTDTSNGLRYPVLEPLVPYITQIMPISLACELLELYFESSSSALMQPVSPYVLGYVFRKQSFLRPNNPRACSPALLASMVWIGCLTSESPYLASSPSARSQMSEVLLDLTISLLKPLVHQTTSTYSADPAVHNGDGVISGVNMGGFGIPTPNLGHGMRELPFVLGVSKSQQLTNKILAGAPGGLDDVATYVHLATVISASEYKAASLRWWNAAWSLAREMRLGKEAPVTPPPEAHGQDATAEVDSDHPSGMQARGYGSHVSLSEEQREERRRLWWLLYTMDR